MAKKKNIDTLSKVVNEIMAPVEAAERASEKSIKKNKDVAAECLEESKTHIEPLIKAYVHAMEQEDKRDDPTTIRKYEIRIKKGFDNAELVLLQGYGSNSMSEYCDSLLRYQRSEKGYIIWRRYNSKRNGLLLPADKQSMIYNSLDDVVRHFAEMVSRESVTFKKDMKAYRDKLERKNKPLLERWGWKKPKGMN